MSNEHLLYRGFFVPILMIILALALLFSYPIALTADSEGPEDIAGASVPAASAGEASEVHDVGGTSESGAPDEIAGASEHQEAYEPISAEPIERQVNNGLLGGGLGASALFFGGAIILDKRREGKK
jgi:hypothetical protein